MLSTEKRSMLHEVLTLFWIRSGAGTPSGRRTLCDSVLSGAKRFAYAFRLLISSIRAGMNLR